MDKREEIIKEVKAIKMLHGLLTKEYGQIADYILDRENEILNKYDKYSTKVLCEAINATRVELAEFLLSKAPNFEFGLILKEIVKENTVDKTNK